MDLEQNKNLTSYRKNLQENSGLDFYSKSGSA
jgi:hypothetical protein